MKKLFIILILPLLFVVTACFASAPDGVDSLSPSIGGDESDPYDIGGLFPSPSVDCEVIGKESGYFDRIDFAPSDSDINPADSFFQAQAGQITAAALSDHKYFKEWQEMLKEEDNSLANYYKHFIEEAQMLYAEEMLNVKIINNGEPLENAIVKSASPNFAAVSNAFGVAYLFGDFKDAEQLNITVTYQGETVTVEDIQIENGELIVETSFSDVQKAKVLDLALVVDTTGSMGDELEYLKVELQSVLEKIEELDVDINLSLIFYRDEGDAYVTRVFDFTNNLPTQYKNLAAQSSYGGGDMPEAVHTALEKAVNLAWGENTTKLLIHVCDAPIHEEKSIYQSFANSTITLAQKGVRMIPVICSGSDTLCELIFRLAALYTGGTYTYITNDSGIGSDHAAPTTKVQTVVEYLNKMLERLIKQYVLGETFDPEPYYKENAYYLTIHVNVNGEDTLLGYIVTKEDPTTVAKLFEEYGIKQGDVVKIIDGEEIEYDIEATIMSDLELKILIPIQMELPVDPDPEPVEVSDYYEG